MGHRQLPELHRSCVTDPHYGIPIRPLRSQGEGRCSRRHGGGTLALLLTIGVVGSVAGWGAYSAFTATTTNAGNTITAGTVAISQHAGATTLYSGTNQAPTAPS